MNLLNQITRGVIDGVNRSLEYDLDNRENIQAVIWSVIKSICAIILKYNNSYPMVECAICKHSVPIDLTIVYYTEHDYEEYCGQCMEMDLK